MTTLHPTPGAALDAAVVELSAEFPTLSRFHDHRTHNECFVAPEYDHESVLGRILAVEIGQHEVHHLLPHTPPPDLLLTIALQLGGHRPAEHGYDNTRLVRVVRGMLRDQARGAPCNPTPA